MREYLEQVDEYHMTIAPRGRYFGVALLQCDANV